MGGWKLEVGKMFIYMAFPVAMFHYFNQPEYFEEWVVKTKRETMPPDNPYARELIKKAVNDRRKMEEVKLLEALEQKVN